MNSVPDNIVFSGNVEIGTDLTVCSPTLFVDCSANRVGVGTITPSVVLDVVGACAMSSTLTVTGNATFDTSTLVVDAGNNRVGVGTATPDFDFEVEKTTSGGTVRGQIENLSDTANSHARLSIVSAGTSAGDAIMSLSVSGTTNWSLGVDNSDSDTFKISRDFAVGTNAVLELTTGDSATFNGTLDVNGIVNLNDKTDSSSVSTGGLICGGGLAVVKSLFTGQSINIVDAYSYTAGSDGHRLDIPAATLTDSSTAESATAALFSGIGLAQLTVAATNATVTTTDASTLYIANAPVAGTNMTLTNAYAINVSAGDCLFGGDVAMNKTSPLLTLDDTSGSGSATIQFQDNNTDKWKLTKTTGDDFVIANDNSMANSLTINTTSDLVTLIGGLTTGGVINIDASTVSTSPSSGALICDGGAGIVKELFVGGVLDVGGGTFTMSQLTNNTDTIFIMEGTQGTDRDWEIRIGTGSGESIFRIRDLLAAVDRFVIDDSGNINMVGGDVICGDNTGKVFHPPAYAVASEPTGVDGDIYYDVTNDVLRLKSAGSWVSVTHS